MIEGLFLLADLYCLLQLLISVRRAARQGAIPSLGLFTYKEVTALTSKTKNIKAKANA